MAGRSIQSRLAAIVIADVVEHSRHMEPDPTGTHERLRTTQDDLVQPVPDAHQSRAVKTMGDAFLLAFDCVVSAFAATVRFQREIAGLPKFPPDVKPD